MKKLKLFSLLMLLFVGVTSMWADNVTISPSQALSDGGVDPITVACARGDGSSNPAISSGQLRLYQAASGKTTGNTITFSSESTITSIVFTFANNMTASNGSFSTGTYDSKTSTWTGEATSVTLTVTGTTSGTRIYITNMVVTYEAGGVTPTCKTPTFDPEDGTKFSETLDVEIACSTDGADIYYTLDGTTPTSNSTKYTAAITLSETKTIKAIAIKDGANNSTVASATYTKAAMVYGYDVDFESDLDLYADWTFENLVKDNTITAHGGSYFANTDGKGTATATTKTKIANPGILTFYISKKGNNTNANSKWSAQVSSNGTDWTIVGAENAAGEGVTEGKWNECTADLSEYNDVYVRVNYKGTTAVRTIDDISLQMAVTKYNITISDAIEHGTVTSDKSAATAGETVTLTADPDDDYRFASWSVNDGAVTVTNNKFTMPEGNVTVSATFEEDVYAVTVNALEHGSITVLDGENPIGANVLKGKTLTVSAAANDPTAYRVSNLRAYLTATPTTPVEITAGQLTMPGEAITITADETALYAVSVAISVLDKDDQPASSEGFDVKINGGSVAYVASDAEELSLVAAEKAGYDFVNWTYDNEKILVDKDDEASTTAYAYEAVTVTAHYKEKSTPEMTVSTNEIDFGEILYKGELAAQSFTIEGANLTGGSIAIAWEDGSDAAAFELSATEVAITDGAANATITVTPRKDVCGAFAGQLNISTSGVSTKTIDLYLTVNKLAHGLVWSSDAATVTINGDDNVFPTLSNPHKLQIELSSEDDAIATFDEGHIVLVAPGTVKIYANTVGSNDTVALPAENAVFYTLTVQKKYTAKWIVNGDTENPIKTQSAVAGTDLEIPSNPTKLADDCEELVFVGWGGKNVAGVQEMVNTTGLKMPEKDTTFYAVFATPQPSDPVKVTDNIDNAFTGVSGNSYVDWSGKAGTSGAVYAGNSAGDYTTVQLRSKNSNSGVVTTATGSGKLSKVTITWNDNTSAARIVDIYGKTTAYEAATDLYASATQGTKLGSLNIDDATDGVSTLVVEGDYTCVGIRSNNSALYLDNIAIEWTTPGSTTYSDSVTVCPTCTTVALTKGATSNGSFQFQVGGAEVSSVKTCEAANVDVVFSPAEGYELSAFTITGVDDANYNEGVISIGAGATGTLIATAEFGLENHKVTMAQTGGASASISADQNNKHAGDEITVTANDVDGYYFIGWAASPEVSFANAKALSTTFTMPSSDVTVTAKYTKILTVAEAVAIIDADKSKTTSDVVVEAYVSSFYSSSVSSGQISYFIQDKDENGFLTGTEFEAYKGKGLNGADFNALDDIAVGDKVRIFGSIKYFSSGDVYEFNANNYLLAKTVKGEVTSVEVYGTASKTEYFNNEDFEFTGLKAKQVFENGYAEEIASPAWAASPAKVTVSGNVAVTATYNEKTSAPYNVAVTKVLREPTLSWSEETPVYLVGQVNTFPTVNNPKSLPLTYESSAPAVAEIDANGEVTLHTAGATTLKFSFAGDDEYAAKQNVEYNLVVYDLESVSVNGTANVTAYEAGSAFNRTGLTAQANYKSGELTTNFNITEDATVVWSCDPATVVAGTSKVTVSATWNGKTGTKDVSVAILTHTVKFADPEHGSLVVKNAGAQIASGDKFANGTVLTVEANPDSEEDYYLAALTVNETDIKAEKEFTVGILTDYTVVATFAERTDAPISWGEASESIALNGDVATLQALTNDEDLTVVYSSDNTNVATVDPATGAITLKGVGSAKISAKYTATTEGQYKTTTVTYTLNVTAATYAVTFNAPTNGTLVILNGSEPITSGDEFVAGTELTVEATPASGYLLATLTANGEDIKSSAKVIIGTADVVVVATFEKDATALDNTEASEKVVKTMENGVLIIRRGDKTYNGQGQLLK